MPDPRMRPAFIVAVSIVVLALVVSLFGLTSLNLPFIRPSGSAETILLFALSTFIFLGLVIFGFILFRSLLKLRTERRANLPGSQFKTTGGYGGGGGGTGWEGGSQRNGSKEASLGWRSGISASSGAHF